MGHVGISGVTQPSRHPVVQQHTQPGDVLHCRSSTLSHWLSEPHLAHLAQATQRALGMLIGSGTAFIAVPLPLVKVTLAR